MPRFRAEEVRPFGIAIMNAAGATVEEATLIVDHHIDAILTGEEDHGLPLGTQYIADMREGAIKTGVPFTIEKESPTTLMVHGNFNFGHYVSHHVMRRLIEKAKTQNVAAASIRYQCHVGRLIDYTAMAAREGMIALMMCDGAWGPKFMAPHGGRDRRLGINPWSMALPNDTGGVVGFDMTAAVSSGSKVLRARERGEKVPEGWLADKDGKPTTDPEDFFRGGSFLPVGGVVAHKGYALCFMIEAMADVLSGMNTARSRAALADHRRLLHGAVQCRGLSAADRFQARHGGLHRMGEKLAPRRWLARRLLSRRAQQHDQAETPEGRH
ncbi:MAG: Ldh family oxidoreductase [Alphaproteobacteria bacterium]